MEIPSRRPRRSIRAPRPSAVTNPPIVRVTRCAESPTGMEVRFNPVPFAARLSLPLCRRRMLLRANCTKLYWRQPVPRRCHLLHKFPAGFPVYARIRARVTVPRSAERGAARASGATIRVTVRRGSRFSVKSVKYAYRDRSPIVASPRSRSFARDSRNASTLLFQRLPLFLDFAAQVARDAGTSGSRDARE